jgi:shikimate kinase
MSVRGVVMTEMLTDPGFDLIYQRTGSVFIPRDDGPAARARVDAMVRGADASTAYVIFPEGRLATPWARVRSLARLRETSPDRCDRLEVLDHLLPPRPGGVTSLLAALPTADVILLDHRGLERFPTVRGLLAAAPIDSTIDIHLRRIPRRDIPVDPTGQVGWLDQLWLELDASLGNPIGTSTDDSYSVAMDQPGPPRNPSEGASNVVLTGFMGTGKSTVGRLLARRLAYEFVDTDEVIEQRHGPIPAIFAQRGEAGFRALERTVARELAERRGLVISTGGRMMLDAANVAALGRSGRVFCLVATAEEILQRVTADDGTIDRPLLAGEDPRRKVVELLAERAPGYARFDQIDTSGRSPDAIAAELAELLRSE